MVATSKSGRLAPRPLEASLGAGPTLFCATLFVYLLNLPFQLWPRFSWLG